MTQDRTGEHAAPPRVYRAEPVWYDTCDACVTTHGPWPTEEAAIAFALEHCRAAGHPPFVVTLNDEDDE